MSEPLIRTKTASGTIHKYYFVKGTATDPIVIECSANTDKVIGIANLEIAGGANGDIIVFGQAKLKLGGTVAMGDRIMPHTDGTGIVATTGNNIGAIAEQNGVVGDIIDVIVSPSTF